MAYTYGNWDLGRQRLPQNNGIGMQLPEWDTPASVGSGGIGMQEPQWNRGAPQTSTLGSIGNTVAGTAAKVASPWLGLGLGAVSAIGNWLGGGYARGVRKRGMQAMEASYNKPVIDVNALTGLRQRAIYANASRLAPGIDRRYGLDQGRGAGALYEGLVGDTANAEADAYYQNALETARKRMMIDQERVRYGR